MSAPELPSEVSADGREIWDWAARLSEHVARQDKIGRLSRDIAKIGRRCGDCDKWMKSRQCPRERNVDGMSRGPSMDAMICRDFIETTEATTRREELTAELAALSTSAGLPVEKEPS